MASNGSWEQEKVVGVEGRRPVEGGMRRGSGRAGVRWRSKSECGWGKWGSLSGPGGKRSVRR